jgi:hypothetical protein
MKRRRAECSCATNHEICVANCAQSGHNDVQHSSWLACTLVCFRDLQASRSQPHNTVLLSPEWLHEELLNCKATAARLARPIRYDGWVEPWLSYL